MKRLWLFVAALFVISAAIAFLTLDHPWAWGTPTQLIAPETTASPPANATVEITYIANEGVLISSAGKQVLIDGLHREYERAYAFLPPPHREKIETAKAPFDQIDLLLVSHRHLDHTAGLAYLLRVNPAVRIYVPKESFGVFGSACK